mgnify:CR=1 FL=1
MKQNLQKQDWWVMWGLLFLGLVPVLAGLYRLATLSIAPQLASASDQRFFDHPLPIFLHAGFGTLFLVMGAFQFSRSFRRRWPGQHRVLGPWLALSGFVSAVSGLWMSVYYPLPDTDGWLLAVFRWIFGGLMTLSVVLGVVAILQKKIDRHRAWMTRAYAIGIGAGTQFFTHLPWLLIWGMHSETQRAWLMAAGWVINLAVAEWWLVHQRTSKARPVTLQSSLIKG